MKKTIYYAHSYAAGRPSIFVSKSTNMYKLIDFAKTCNFAVAVSELSGEFFLPPVFKNIKANEVERMNSEELPF